MKVELVSLNVSMTKQIAACIASFLKEGMVLTLDGHLGAGKTTFTQGLGKALGVEETINSPTFNILKCYFSGRLPLYHIDAYRLEDHVNDDIGLEEVIQGDGVCVIEWSKFIEDKVFEPLKIEITIIDQDKRKFLISTEYGKYSEIMEGLKSLCF